MKLFKIYIFSLIILFSTIMACDNIPGLSGIDDNKPEKQKSEFILNGKMLVAFADRLEDPIQIYEAVQGEGNIVFNQLSDCDVEGCGYLGNILNDNYNFNYDFADSHLVVKYHFLTNFDKSYDKLINTEYRYDFYIKDWHPSREKIIIFAKNKVIAKKNEKREFLLFEYDLYNGEFKHLCDKKLEICNSAAYSPDGSEIMISKQKKDDEEDNYAYLTIKDQKDNKDNLFISSKKHIINPIWSSDGKYVLFSECNTAIKIHNSTDLCGNSDCKLYLVDFNNPEEKIFIDDYITQNVSINYDFSPDLTQIAYSKFSDGRCKHDIYVRNMFDENNKLSISDSIKITKHDYSNTSVLTGYVLLGWGDIAAENTIAEENTFSFLNNSENVFTENIKFKEITAGQEHFCGTSKENELWCFGNNSTAQFGNKEKGFITSSNIPKKVNNFKWNKITANEGHTCGIKDDNTLWCWGRNESGQIGDGTSGWDKIKAEPVQISDETWLDVAAGESYTCGIKSEDQSLWCWGSNYFNQHGDDTFDDKHAPELISPEKWKNIESANHYTCGIKEDNKLWCWGFMRPLQVRNMFKMYQMHQVDNDEWIDLSLGSHHLCGIKSDKSVWCQYEVYYTEPAYSRGFGHGYLNPLEPEQKDSDSWKTVSAGGYFTCGIKEDGTLWCWGLNHMGQAGTGTTHRFEVYEYPVQVGEDDDWKSVAAGRMSACAVKENGDLYCWGSNMAGQLGTGNYEDSLVPVKVN